MRAAVLMSLALLLHSTSFAKPAPTRPIKLTEEQVAAAIAAASLPVDGLKTRRVAAVAGGTYGHIVSHLRIHLETHSYESTARYSKCFAVECTWRTPEDRGTLACVYHDVVEVVGDPRRQKIRIGGSKYKPSVNPEEVIEIVQFLHSDRNSWGMISGLSRRDGEYVVGIGGFGVEGGGCIGSVNIRRADDGSLVVGSRGNHVCI